MNTEEGFFYNGVALDEENDLSRCAEENKRRFY